MTERTLVLLKPDAVQRGLVGPIISRFEERGLQIVALKLMRLSEELAHRHYAEHRGKPFFEGLIRFITSAPVVAMVVQGPGSVAAVRTSIGATDPATAAPGTVRGDLATDLTHNLVHGSDSAERGRAEIELFFSPADVIEWERSADQWILG